MHTLKYSGSKDKKTEILPSHPDQQSEQSDLLPFLGELIVDEKLELSNPKFKQIIDDFFEDQTITPLSQLTVTPAFPTPHVLAQFAFKAYTDYEKQETDAQYETGLELPDGWKLLTTASNGSMTNGYFGAACWHPEHQQVVIAHRGTNPTNFGALWTDLKGVMRNKYVRQMESASTFAHKVVEVLESVSQEKGVIFQLFYTGHSLGGWLAQITTFTTKYLQIKGNVFLKGNLVQDCYHPHTVVFESPGCKNMLSQMTDKLDVRLEGRSIDIELLDITSYLSAPNRINTCNEHLGTVYRIFTDLSDMGWLGKHTALYNLATHSMDKIVEAFDPNTGQVRKDEQGKLKVHVVIDWPVSSGLRGGEEYQSFFTGAKHLNDYHQGVTDVTFQIKGYHPMRYQTKPYDEGVSRLSVFCQQERQFLESYLWLRQLPECYKPEQLFSKMGDNEVQEQVEEILKKFEIKKDKIHCTDGSALQAFIPYVKRLLQLFPEVKQSTTNALKSDEVRKSVYQIETRRYIERISQSQLDFKRDDLSLRDFVRSDHEQVLQLQMVDGDEWTGLIKAYQVLQQTGCLIEGQYTVLKLECLLTLNKLMDFSELMHSTVTPHLLLMACEANQLLNDEEHEVMRAVFNTIKHKPYIKVLLFTQSEVTTLRYLQHIVREIFGEGFVTRFEQLTWCDLTASSQEKLLEKLATFQGTEISLNKLMSAESPLAKLLPLGALLKEKQITIADTVPISSGYNEGYYIGRTLHHHRAIKEEIFIDKRKKEFPDLIASTEQEFKQLCQLNPNSNVHWLQKEKSGKLVWHQTQGSLEILHRYMDTDISHTYTPDNLDKLLEQAQHQRVIVISDTAGMGKSTVLTHLSKQIKQNFPAKLVVRIDLNDHTDALKTLEEGQIDKEKAIEFVSQKVLKHKPGLEMELFKQCCEQKQKVRAVIMLDGFDEISPYYKETVIELMQALRQTAVEQLWVTTRPHLREGLEDRLQQLSYTLEPFSEENQIEFLTKFWSLKDWVTKMDNNEKEETNKKLEIYAVELIKRLGQSISDKDREFTGIPLQTRMLAEAFEKELKTFCQSPESKPELPSKLDLIGLYRKFIESKYDIYQEEKFQVRKTSVIATEQRRRDLKCLREDHQLLALKVLFDEEQVSLFQTNEQCTFSARELSRIGVAQISHDGQLHFIHRTFAEYYVADILVNHLTEGNNTPEEVQTFILKDILQEEYSRVIRVFVDGLLSKAEPSQELLKQHGNGMHNLGEDGVLILHQAVQEDNANIIGFLLDSVQVAGHTDTVNRLLLAEDDDMQTAWYMAACGGNMQALVKLWKYANEQLTPEELNIKLLLAKDNGGSTAWHVAAKNGNLQVLQQLWEWAKEKLPTEEIKYKFLLGKNNIEETAFQGAAVQGKIESLETLWKWTKEELTTEELKNEVLLAKGKRQQTVWHNVSLEGNTLFLEKLWEWAEEKLTAEEIRNKILLAQDDRKKTIWHCASLRGNIQLLEKLWVWANRNLTPDELKTKLLLAKDIWGQTAWYVAAWDGYLEMLEKQWEWAEEVLTPGELKNEFLLATTELLKTNSSAGQYYEQYTPLQIAAQKDYTDVFLKLWEWTKEKLTTEELMNEVLLAKDDSEQTVWHTVAQNGNTELLEKLWDWAKEKLTPEELKNKLLLAKGDREETVFHIVAGNGYTEVLHKLWEWAKEKLNSEELKYKFFLAKNNMDETAFHSAAAQGKTESLETLWMWAKKELTPEELKNEVLLAKGHKEQTVWYNAALEGNTLFLEELWKWAEEKLTIDEINNKLLLAQDRSNQTIWHCASQRGNIQLLEKIWEWAKGKLTLEKMNKQLLLAKDIWGKTAWHVAAEQDKLEVLQKQWEWAKAVLTPQELKNELLLATVDLKNAYGLPVSYSRKYIALQQAAQQGKTEVFRKLWEWTKEELTTEELINEVLLVKDDRKRTVWHMAAKDGNYEVIQKLWEWAEEKLTPEEINNKLLLDKDTTGKTAWHVAAEGGKRKVLQLLWEWAKERLNPEEINNKLLLAQDSKKQTVWHYASLRGNLAFLQEIWDWAKEKVPVKDLNKKLLLDKNNLQMTAWHMAAEKGNLQVLEKQWEWAKEVLTQQELKSKFLLATVEFGEIMTSSGTHTVKHTALHEAALEHKRRIFRKLWQWTKEELSTEELKNEVLLAKGEREQTVWHTAARTGNIHALQKLWEWAKENITPEESIKILLLDRNMEGKTAWHIAAKESQTEVLQKLWEWAKEKLKPGDLKIKFLLAKSIMEQTAFHMAAVTGTKQVLQALWECAKETLTTEELKVEVLLAKDLMEQTVWHVAVEEGNTLFLEKLCDLAEETLTPEEIINKLLLAQDKRKQTIWHWIILWGNIHILEKLWKWANEKLRVKDLHKTILLAKDIWGGTAWHVAAERGKLKMLEKQWEWAKEVLTPEEVKNELLLNGTSNIHVAPGLCLNNYTALQEAAKRDKTEVFLKIWEWTEEVLTTEELKNEVLLAKDDIKENVWHIAAKNGNIHIVEKIWEWSKEKVTQDDLNKNLLLAKNILGKTAWHLAAESGNLEVLNMQWEWAKEVLTPQELKNEFLLARVELEDPFSSTDEYSRKHTAFQKAAEEGITEVFLKLWEWSKEELTTEEVKNEVLLAKDDRRQTLWHMAAKNDNPVLLEELWDWAKEKLSPEELNNRLLLAKDDVAQTAFHIAAECGTIQVLQKIWEYSKEKLMAEEIKNEFLLANVYMDKTIFHVAAGGGETGIVHKLWKWAKEELTPQELKDKCLLAKSGKQTLFHLAAMQANTKALHELWECAKEKLSKEELKDELLLAKDDMGRTAWHIAAEMDHTEVLAILWEWAKEELTPQEFINKCLLGKDDKKRTAWHIAAKDDNIHVIEKIWEWANEKPTQDDLNKKLLLTKNILGKTTWHMAAETANLEVLSKQWEWAKEILTPQELKNELLLARVELEDSSSSTDEYSRKHTAFQMAAEEGITEVFLKLWEWSKEELTTEEVKNEVLLAKDDRRQTLWHMAAKNDNPVLLEKLWDWAKEKLTPEELNNRLLLAKDGVAQTAFHVAAECGTIQVLQKIWEYSKDKLMAEEIKNEFLLANVYVDKTVFHVAAGGGETGIVHKLWKWAKEELTPQELKDKCLLAKSGEQTAFHVAAMQANTEALHELWECAKEKLSKEELKDELLLAKDDMGRTAWHNAAEMDHTQVLETLWEWAKEELTPQELINKWLLDKDDKKRTAWYLAAQKGNIYSLQRLWKWAKQELTVEELKIKWLLGKDDRERTAFDVAAEEEDTDVLENLHEWALQEFSPEELNNLLCLSTNLFK